MRPRLSDRNAVRRGLRARGCRGRAGSDRPPATLRHRHADARERAPVQAGRADRKARGGRRRRACGSVGGTPAGDAWA
ncbi:hypothetical protein RB2654_14990 [Rhodobacterales bacterium HTCC2654]|uniref:Uncharacterized protein n=1 Tax=Maritimibacter alkaliphilus HTCC2654 TaxID=314271 RepID=A3VH47_9RHOB|nr:hypothetical protein RB2654_14990 [Rhodobacterales bacterium HTCC2654] [Maritimibacter alkaliphilus HTCC2654]